MVRAFIASLRLLPYRWRVPLAGWAMSRLIAPLLGYRKRIRENLALVCPEVPADEVERLVRAVPDNMGRTFVEMFSGAAFRERALRARQSGAGLAAVEQAVRDKRPIVFISGHFGNYDAARVLFAARIGKVGALYRPLNNQFINAQYVAAITSLAEPLFPRGRRGMAKMLAHLRGGGALALLIDQHMRNGAPLTFFGHEAYTALSAAEMALKYDALVIPVYATRQPNGLDFAVEFEAPIPHTTPEEMTQALNDSLEARVRGHMGQWLWTHRRWKPLDSPADDPDTE
ncbi:MAG TPA: lysophospholipid acyltransferase family protein [Paracoccaceae bacterium]|nr:lysophospholipid acyltransferase family protein [Paracoccaceae bacterium]